jgi:sugar transferase (PEP-CTERM/EpsH1 system associated)
MHIVYALRPGGMEFGVVKLVNGLDRARVRSSICSTKPAGVLKHLVASEVPVFELNRRDGNDPRLVWQLYRLFREQRPHVVHTHAWGTLVEGLVAARLAGVPAVVHGEHGTLQLRRYQRWLQRTAWCAADQVLAVSSRLAERMAAETRIAAARVTTIRNGVDLSRFSSIDRAAARAALSIDSSASVVGSVGRLVAVKDHMTLLEAMAQLRRDGLTADLLLAGDGPLRDSLVQRASALGITGHVRFLGHRGDVETALAALDVFVLSSVSEGLSNTILEAMATRLPVVATRVGGADELVDDGVTGILVPAGDPEALSAALGQVLRDPELARTMGHAGRRRVEASFDLATMVRQYEALYRDLAARKGTVATAVETGCAGVSTGGGV